MTLKWINSSGGPLVCGTIATLGVWRGTRGSSVDGARSDYERACDQMDYLSQIDCGSYQVLVLGDEPLQSTFILKDGDVSIVRWASCLSNDHAINAIAQFPFGLEPIDESIEFRLEQRGLIMFDAALTSIESAACGRTDLNAGEFLITTEKFKRDRVCEFLVHRFIRK